MTLAAGWHAPVFIRPQVAARSRPVVDRSFHPMLRLFPSPTRQDVR